MEVYVRNDESRPCECGGKRCLTPSIKLKHEGTIKHREKVEKLKVMKTIVCV